MELAKTLRRRRTCVTAVIFLLFPVPSPAGEAQDPTLTLMGGAGVTGGTVAVALQLGNVLNRDVVEAFADLRFDADLLSVDFDNCLIAPEIQSTHVLEGEAGAGRVQLSVLSEPEPVILPPCVLTTCVFDIALGITAGTVATITFADAGAVGPGNNPLEVSTLPGIVIISVNTPVPTPTRTVGPTFTVRSASAPSDCSVAPAGQAHPLGSWLLLGGATLLFIRRRW